MDFTGCVARGDEQDAAESPMSFLSDWWPYLLLIAVGFLPNEAWRILGLVASRGIDENSELIIWVRAVATATLVGVVSKIIVFAPGALGMVPLWVRLAAATAAIAAFFLLRRSVFASLAAAVLALLAGIWATG
jgi:Branched-chain amino acid transport protein (AzlD)